MADARTSRISRELFLAAFGAGPGQVEPWVIDRLTAVVDASTSEAQRNTLMRQGEMVLRSANKSVVEANDLEDIRAHYLRLRTRISELNQPPSDCS